MAVPGDCRNTVCISKSPGAVMGKQIHSKPYESLCESAQPFLRLFTLKYPYRLRKCPFPQVQCKLPLPRLFILGF